jgi:hypothetical protein
LKIIDNPSTKQILGQIRALETLESLYNLLPWANRLCPKFTEIFSDFSEIKSQVEMLLLPDQFNEIFALSGWIAYESLNADVIKKAIEIAENSEFIDAEKFLADYYDEDTLKWAILRFNGHPDFYKRLRLVELAKDDYFAERYHACIPLLISLTDGLVNDISKHVGIFAQNSDMTAWDSIAAHETGLQSLVKLLGSRRNKTNEEEIIIPFRNGILHGRELAFDNKIVAAKCWSTLFAVRDWASSIAEGKKNPIIKEQVSWSKLLKRHLESIRISQLLEQWEPRTVQELNYLPSSNSSNLPENSPEKAIADFVENWSKKRFKEMAEALRDLENISIGKKAGQVKRDFGEIDILSYEIRAVEDKAASASHVHLHLEFSIEDKSNVKKMWICAIYQDDENNPLIYSMGGGKWKIVQNGFNDVVYSA